MRPGSGRDSNMSGLPQSKPCRHCGAEMSAEQLVCPRCGKVRRPAWHIRCQTCGTINSRSRKSCIVCGAPLHRRGAGPAAVVVIVLGGLLVLFMAVPRLRQGLSRIPLLNFSIQGTPTGVAPATIQASATAVPPTETPTPTEPPPTATDTPTPTPTPRPTWTSRPTRTPPPSRTPSPTVSQQAGTPTPEDTAVPTWTATATPTQTPTPAPPTPTPSPTEIIYTVRSGDTLYDIAARFDTTIDAIVEANHLTSTDLRTGQHLVIPAATPTPTPATPTPTAD